MPVLSGRTRWMLAAGGAVAGVAVITGTMAVVGAPSRTATFAPAAAVAPPAAVPTTTATSTAAPTTAAPTTTARETDEPAARPLGDVIRSGMRAKKGEWVFYAVPIANAGLPDVTFGVMAGRRLPDGTTVGSVVVNETEGSPTSPGFHAVEGAMEVEGEFTPAFGYYAGPAAKITATVKGRTVTAHQRTWSENRSVVVFWFDLSDVRAKATHAKADAGDASGIPGNLKAYDRSGRRLPSGHATVAVG